MVEFELNGAPVRVDDDCSLLEALRDHLAVRSAKDGCSPQGQCGCCTVWIDGAARVACVTPVKRVAGRSVTTVEGLEDAAEWAAAFCSAGASQCGFCTPGIIMRLAALSPEQQQHEDSVRTALLAHMCRCTGWTSIVDASTDRVALVADPRVRGRDLEAAERRAALEGGVAQRVHPDVALGRGGFTDDDAPADALVALLADDGSWVVRATVSEARASAGKIQGRRTTEPPTWPIGVPESTGAPWDRTLQTTWVEPAYLEPDAAWCGPAGRSTSALGNGGAFGGKSTSDISEVARRLAAEHGQPVRVLLTREDTVRVGPKRPPVALGLRADGTGIMCLARPATTADEAVLCTAIEAAAPGVLVEFVDVLGPQTSALIRAAGWAEAAAAISSLTEGPDTVVAPNGASTTTWWEAHGQAGLAPTLHVSVECGAIVDEVVLRSYCLGAAHMAMGWVLSECLAVGVDGVPLDLTIRSFGVLRAVDTPRVDLNLMPSDNPAVNGSDAVFAAVAAATWRREGHGLRWPIVT